MTEISEPDFLAGVPKSIAHLSWLIGTWTGFGVGDSKTDNPYRYEETIQFATDGREFLEYRSVAWLVDDDGNRLKPAHTETGFFRGGESNSVEALISHPTGLIEVSLGEVEVTGIENARITGARMILKAALLRNTETGQAVDSATRMFGLVNDKLFIAHDRAVDGESERNHYAIELVRS